MVYCVFKNIKFYEKILFFKIVYNDKFRIVLVFFGIGIG